MPETTARQIDSLIANEFALEVEGEQVSGIFTVANLQTYATNDEGNRIKPPFEISKMVQRDGTNAMNTWLRETMDARDSDETPTRTITVVAVDDGVETRRWEVSGAHILNIAYSTFDSSSFEMIAETLTIGYDDIDESFPVMDED